MKQLVYASSTGKELSDNDLMKILEQSRKNNKARNITGMLLYADDSFLQVIEGDDEEIDSLYAVIAKDIRHQKPTVYVEKSIDQREFSEWEMGFKKLGEQDLLQVEGYSDFMEEDFDFTKLELSQAISYLHQFKILSEG